MTELEKYKLNEKIIIYRKLRFRGFHNFVIDFFKNEIEKNIFDFANLPKLILEKKTDEVNVLIEDAWEKIKNIDFKEINHKEKIIFKKLNKAYCTNCNQIIYIASDFLEAKKRIELDQPIIINDEILEKDLIENLVENHHNCLIFYSDLFEKKEIVNYEDLF